jgi:hypothetical protein
VECSESPHPRQIGVTMCYVLYWGFYEGKALRSNSIFGVFAFQDPPLGSSTNVRL